jgi:hypothetical protein
MRRGELPPQTRALPKARCGHCAGSAGFAQPPYSEGDAPIAASPARAT